MSVMVGAVLAACSFNGMKSLGGVPSGVVDLLTASEADNSIRSHDYEKVPYLAENSKTTTGESYHSSWEHSTSL